MIGAVVPGFSGTLTEPSAEVRRRASFTPAARALGVPPAGLRGRGLRLGVPPRGVRPDLVIDDLTELPALLGAQPAVPGAPNTTGTPGE